MAPGRVCVEDKGTAVGRGPAGVSCVELGVCDECVLGYYKCVFLFYVNVVCCIGVQLIFKMSSYKANLYGKH